MDYSLIIRPLIGAGIGYVTNWIAVKMLFRPLKPIQIGKFTLPFTPGIIPKNKIRIAESIGKSISENLLTEESITNVLLSDKKLQELKLQIEKYLETTNENNITIKDTLCTYLDEAIYNKSIISLKSYLTNSIFNTVLEAELHELIAKQIQISAENKLKGSLLGFFGGNSIISSLTSNVSISLNDYISTNGEELIGNMVDKEINKYTSTSLQNIAKSFSSNENNLSSMILDIYKKIIIEKVPVILKSINISDIVVNQINSMDTLELEKIILSIMKKELNALVNLGALIGFILGLFNLVI